jgi:hypothetical protein
MHGFIANTPFLFRVFFPDATDHGCEWGYGAGTLVNQQNENNSPEIPECPADAR